MKKKVTPRDIAFFHGIVKKAGNKAAAMQRRGITMSRKQDRSIVTQADLYVQDYLVSRITRRFGPVNFIHEEGQNRPLDAIGNDTITIIIDPIDGTAMYSMHMPIWCVSLGVYRGYEPLYGFVFAPGIDMFFHNDDKNAYLNGRTVQVTKDFVIDTETNIFYATEIYKRIMVNFPGKARNLGSTALHACLTVDNARNRTLAFIGKSRIWDWGGAIPIILKAGGSLRYINGTPFSMADVLTNDLELTDFLIAYTCRSFDDIKSIFVPV
jgi:myo-inositol-1(or 4)-monophosphatase